MISRSLLVALCLAPLPVLAQSLTPEQIAAMVDEKVNTPNPYAALLNHADEARGLAAMEVLLKSGDEALVDMALEFGLLSVNSGVRRQALEAFLAGKPMLTLRVDGIETSGGNRHNFERWMSGDAMTLAPGPVGVWRIPVGDYDSFQRCFTYTDSEICLASVGSDGVVLNGSSRGGLVALDDGGALSGTATLANIGTVPVEIRLLD